MHEHDKPHLSHPEVLSMSGETLALLLAIVGYSEGLQKLGATRCEARQALFTLMIAAFITLTLVGIFLRGEGMALVW